MKKHIRIYLQHHGFGEQDFIPCRYCGARAVDIHHLVFKSHGGKDTPENLIALCREHHDKAHREPEFNEQLKRAQWKH